MKKIALTLSFAFLLFIAKSYSQDWTYVTSTGTTFILYGMSFPPGQSTIGYACGMQYTYDADGVIVKTTDGGNNWTQIWPASGTIDGLQGIWFTSDLVGFACGWNNYFIKTTDGGSTWTPVTVGSDVWYYRDVEFWDANNGVALAVQNNPSNQCIYITSNGGTSWTPSTSGMATADVMGISYASSTTIFGVGTSGNVYKSTDGGQNWIVAYTIPAMLLGVDFANTTFGVVGGEEQIFATNNGGASWTTYTTGYENFYATKAFADGTAFVGGTDENIYKTTNYGSSWSMEFNGTGTSTLYRIRDVPNGTLFACGSQGKIMKRESELQADFTASQTTVCTGNTVNFTDNSTGNYTTWAWTFEGGTPSSSTSPNPSVTYNTAGTYDAQLTITGPDGSNTELKTDYITVYNGVTQPITPDGPTEICGTYTVQYTTETVQYATNYSWQVNPPSAGSITGNSTTGTFTASNTWSGTYTVKVRAESDCGAGPWSNELTCTSYHNPIVYDLLGDGGFCEGDPGAEITLSGSESGVTYELFKDNVTTGIIVAGTGSPFSFGVFDETGFYTATGYTPDCSENMVGQIYVYVEAIPGQTATPQGPTDVCNGESADYTTTGATDADEYEWELDPSNAGIIASNGEECNIVWSNTFTGAASLTVTGSNDCGTGSPSDELTISVNSLPQPVITGLTIVCDNDESEYSTPDHAGSTYTWTVIGGTIISGAGTWQINVMWGNPGAGSIGVTELSSEGCEGYSPALQITIDDCTGIDEGFNAEVNVYPNPTSGDITISADGKKTIWVYDILGNELITLRSDHSDPTIDMTRLEKGIYFVKVERESEKSIFKVVKN